jgi:hypothetical protein
MAMFLSHWDNKGGNQRLVCLAPLPDTPMACPQSFAIVHDLGATFGPNKVDLPHWRATPVWADAAACRVSMKSLPYSGGTFREAQISEAGRALIVRQLDALSERQIRDLFEGARFASFSGWFGRASPVSEWVKAFLGKVEEIESAGPCPS